MPAENKKALPDVSFDFNTAVNEAYKNYPKLKKTVFYDVANNKVHGKNLVSKGLARLRWRRAMKAQGSAAFTKGKEGKKGIMIFAPVTADKNILYKTGNGSFAFDHELGHLLTGSLRYPGKPKFKIQVIEYYDLIAFQAKNECIADAFAAIRHFQRYGTDGADIPKLAVFRAHEAPHYRNMSHLSTSVIARIWADRHTTDFSSLSPEETWQKAQDYAEKYTPAKDDLRLIDRDLISRAAGAPVFNEVPVPKRTSNLPFLELAATTCLTTANSNVFLTAAAVVVPLVTSTRPVLTDPDWLKVVDKIQERAQQLAVANLLNMFKQNTADITKWDKAPSPKDAEILGVHEQRAATARLLKL